MGNVIVTGGTGFVGANLARYLLHQGEEVFLFVRQESQLWRIQDIISQIHLVQVDFNDSGRLYQIVREIQPEVVYHLATYGAYPYRNGKPFQQDFDLMIQTNIQGTINLLRASAQTNVRKFISVGSSSEYGIKEQPMKEADVLIPSDIYGATKGSAYLIGMNIAQLLQLPYLHVRLFSVYGAYEERARLIPTVMINHLLNNPLALANSRSVRDFIYIEDVVEGLIFLANHLRLDESVINLGTGIQSSVNDVVNQIRVLSQNQPEINWGSIDSKPNEPLAWVANSSRLKASGFQPQYSLREGLAVTYQWFSENLGLYNL